MFDMLELVTNYILTMVSLLFIVLFTHLIFSLKFKYRIIASYIAFAGIISSTAVFFVNYIGINKSSVLLFIITYIISTVILMKVVFKIGFLKCSISAGIYALVLALGFIITYFVRHIFGFDGKYFEESFWRLLLVYTIINTVNFAVYIILRSFKMISKFPKEIKIKAYIVNTLYISIASGGTVYNFWYFYKKPFCEINRLIFLFNIVLLLSFFIFSNLNINTFFNFEFKSRELKYQIFYNKTLEKLMGDLRVFKHNYDNLLASIKCFIEAGQIEELNRFINETIEKKNKIDLISNLMLLNIKNAGLLGIITSKLEYAGKMGIDIKVCVQDEINEINIKISDLCEILGILLDNAIEASALSEDKLVRLTIRETVRVITFSIENSTYEKPSVGKIFEKGYSTKGEGRGLGLWILRNTVNNYNNVLLNTFSGDNIFRQELIIN